MSVERAIKSCKACCEHNASAKKEGNNGEFYLIARDRCRMDAQQALEDEIADSKGWLWDGSRHQKALTANIACMNCNYTKPMIADTYKKK
ncbi:hypothetical protein KY328_00705 [Candidatus Woesearchaeota archaeon]|nr:hypothetical protein [Candidatus Woesearchaeota archaeon]MBW3021417.1 hypothetical protein [Candidatus Woesearchaeota archaeon]